MTAVKHVLCVSTTKPTTSLSPSGGGGTMTVVDPMTGACLSSLRVTADMSGKNALGISSASAFPSSFVVPTSNSANTRLAIAYGSNRAKKGDTYAMLLSIRSASSPPLLHWKCRLPEADLAGGISTSPCGHYLVGGGSSGTCFVWSSLGGGALLRTFKAHYRSVTCLAWSDCGRYLVTGGADGMVHLYLLMELVDQSGRTSSSKRPITPLHTWSIHHFPVTCLTPMDSGRMASGAEDGHIVIMELFSKTTVSTIKVPDGITCLAYHDSRLFTGTISGRIFSMDLDAYAMHQTEKQGAMLSQAERQKQAEFITAQERIFGKPKEDESASTRLFQSEWIGHERTVSSIAFLVEGHKERLISGDELGQLRIWDVESRTCLKVLQPWSNTHVSAATSAASKTSKPSAEGGNHPISSIMIIAQPQDPSTGFGSSGMFGSTSTSHQKSQVGIANLVPPLQKYTQEQQQTNSTSSVGASTSNVMTTVPFLKCNQASTSLSFWQARTIPRKRKRKSGVDANSGTVEGAGHKGQNEAKLLEEARARISKLEQDLATKGVEVERWEKVNNKLISKLKANS